MIRKYRFARLENCSNRFIGTNETRLYLQVVMRLLGYSRDPVLATTSLSFYSFQFTSSYLNFWMMLRYKPEDFRLLLLATLVDERLGISDCIRLILYEGCSMESWSWSSIKGSFILGLLSSSLFINLCENSLQLKNPLFKCIYPVAWWNDDPKWKEMHWEKYF